MGVQRTDKDGFEVIITVKENYEQNVERNEG
jgi:hypothetical protein